MSWIKDLNERITFFKDWYEKGTPTCFCISRFSFPQDIWKDFLIPKSGNDGIFLRKAIPFPSLEARESNYEEAFLLRNSLPPEHLLCTDTVPPSIRFLLLPVP